MNRNWAITILIALMMTTACATTVDTNQLHRIESKLRNLSEVLDAQVKQQKENGVIPEEVEVPVDSRIAVSSSTEVAKRMAMLEKELERLIIISKMAVTFWLCPKMEVEIPKPIAESKASSLSLDKIVFITKDGQVLVDGEVVANKDTSRLFSEWVKHNTSMRLIIQADKEAGYHDIVKVMDLAKQAGIQNIAIASP